MREFARFGIKRIGSPRPEAGLRRMLLGGINGMTRPLFAHICIELQPGTAPGRAPYRMAPA
jgi:hypothetical protein